MNAIIPSRRRTGFTLVEVLVVTGILAILFALATGVAIKALASAEDARTAADIRQLEVAIASFQAKFNVEYLPSQITLYTKLDRYATANQQDWQYLTKVWNRLSQKVPNSNPPVTNYINWGQIQGFSNQDLTYTLQGDQCLAFFLGGCRYDTSPPLAPQAELGGPIGFSPNPFNPMAIPLQNTNEVRVGPFFEFDAKRYLYANPTAGTRGQFPSYQDAYVKGSPYYYFSSYRAGYIRPGQTNPERVTITFPNVTGSGELRAYREPGNGQFFNSNSFQIISAGRDAQVGAFTYTNTLQATEWKNGSYGPTMTIWNPNKSDFADDLCNFHPVKISIPQ